MIEMMNGQFDIYFNQLSADSFTHARLSGRVASHAVSPAGQIFLHLPDRTTFHTDVHGSQTMTRNFLLNMINQLSRGRRSLTLVSQTIGHRSNETSSFHYFAA